MKDDPKYFTEIKAFGDSPLKFTGEKFDSDPILDTKVELNDETLCWIVWKDREKFAKELNDVLSKYRI